jgi:hypothetical protein
MQHADRLVNKTKLLHIYEAMAVVHQRNARVVFS